MKLRNPDVRSALAGEYVTGSLSGGARRRFERLLEDDPSLRGEVEGWQTYLYQLVDLLPEHAPPIGVWEKLASRIVPDEPGIGGLWDSLPLWRCASMLAGACAILLVIGIWMHRDGPKPIDYHVVVADQDQRAAWLITTELGLETLEVRTLSDQTLGHEQSFELWLIVPSDGAPISLGFIPETGSTSLSLTPTNIARFAHAAALAVSLEPAGGSPSGFPTGPVLYEGTIAP